MTQKEFYKTRAWRRVRDSYIQTRIATDGGICEACGCQLGKIVHHIIWLDDINCNDPSVSLNPENFRYECQDCHNREQDPRKQMGCCRYSFGLDGSIIPADSPH